MSDIRWSQIFVPPAGSEAQNLSLDFYGPLGMWLERAIAVPVDSNAIDIPDRRAYRSMSRAALLMSQVCLQVQSELASTLARDPFRVGLYCAVDGGPLDYPSADELARSAPEEFHEKYKKLRTPKMYLKQLPNLAPAQVGIFLKIQGPLHVYNHSTAGSLQALEQAEADLQDNIVDLALVTSGFSFEDPMQAFRARRQAPRDTLLCEGAGALLLAKGTHRTNWAQHVEQIVPNQRYYGISHAVIELAAQALSGGN
ncbi:MAG: hypothetical protein JST16_11875 [Bdellovibrionales bacterium]|nr:hypothetical protein [Bdellovibrionales bacterium]